MKQGTFVTTCLALLVVLFALPSFGQTITTGAVPNSLCPGDTVLIPFTTTGTFQPKNAFTAQISNKYGNFDSDYASIGTTRDTITKSIEAIIPSFDSGSTHYRIRVISGLPFIKGSDNGSDVTIGSFLMASFTPSRLGIFVNDTVTFINRSDKDGTYLWNFGDGANPQSSTSYNPGPITYSTKGVKYVSLAVTSLLGCTSSYSFPIGSTFNTSNLFEAYDCFPAIPHSAVIIDSSISNYSSSDSTENNLWIVSGGSLSGIDNNIHTTVFIEPGGYINISSCNNITIYAKAGATCIIGKFNATYTSVIYEDESGIIYLYNNLNPTNSFLKCDSLKFDYTNAPPYNFPTLGVHDRLSVPIAVSLYPNPVNNILHVFTGATMPTAVRLFNTLGEEVWSSAGHVTNSVQITTDNLLNGVYYLQVTAPGKMSTEKVTVIH